MKLAPVMKPAAIGAAILVVASVAYLQLYAWPRDALLTKIQQQRKANGEYEAALKDERRLRDELRRLARHTVGSGADQATARFRTALGEIGKSCGLAVASVNSQDPARVGNPAGAKVRTRVGSLLREQTDFFVIRGTLNASGTLEQSLRAMATIQAQPWVHRVESFTLKPQEKDRFSLTLGVATILMPDLAPADAPDPRIVALDPLAATRWAGIVKKNPFREPAVRVARADPPPGPAGPPAPPQPPWDDWKLTGIAESPRRTEALLLNTKTDERLVLAVGASVTGATFAGGSRGRGLFDIGGERFEVLIGQSLAQRSPAGR